MPLSRPRSVSLTLTLCLRLSQAVERMKQKLKIVTARKDGDLCPTGPRSGSQTGSLARRSQPEPPPSSNTNDVNTKPLAALAALARWKQHTLFQRPAPAASCVDQKGFGQKGQNRAW
eukprot:1068310-Rhodomonas_salina.3